MPEFIAAVMPTTRWSRRASSTSASPKTACTAAAPPARPSRWGAAFFGAAAPFTIEPGFAACHFSMPSSPPSSAGTKPLPFTVLQWTTTGRSASSASPIACGAP